MHKQIFVFTDETGLESTLSSLQSFPVSLSVDRNASTLSICADSITSLDDMISDDNTLTYEAAAKLFNDLKDQINFLDDHNLGIHRVTPSDVLVIISQQKVFFLLTPTIKLHPIKNNMFTLITPSVSNRFMAPEHIMTKRLPADLHKGSVYYSIGVLVVHCLANRDINYDNKEHILNTFGNTPLSFAIDRCIQKNPEDRTLLLL